MNHAKEIGDEIKELLYPMASVIGAISGQRRALAAAAEAWAADRACRCRSCFDFDNVLLLFM